MHGLPHEVDQQILATVGSRSRLVKGKTMGASTSVYDEFIRPHWTEPERTNLQIVGSFVEGIKAKKFDEVIEQYKDSAYIQHNRSVQSGVKAIVEVNKKLAKQFPEFTLTAKHVYVDGEFVTFHSHVTFKAKHRGDDTKGLNVVDIWKVSDGNIVEHWDSLQPLDFMSRLLTLLTGGAIRNDNGVF
ncbi:nuclear transport factor 2 family protein [uncultured Hoeflea sp.]|uniref:nuclear transport factor 2 family protein n=1 Tax=uncultured Hoeflea sp. TaxID=538666 RepID=UPI002626B127|nr:nuclear transport factor 2 family protein [uncultured Hoeflea sp.]